MEQTVNSENRKEKQADLNCDDLIMRIEEVINLDLIRLDEANHDVQIKLYEKPLLCSSNDRSKDEYIYNQSDDCWQFCFCRVYKGFDCKSMILVRVNSYTGKIKQISNFPFIIPEETTVNVSKEEAIKIALKFAEKNKIRYKEYDVKQFIINPNNFFALSRFFGLRISSFTRLSWIVTLKANDSTYRIETSICIDCSNGKIIGGAR